MKLNFEITIRGRVQGVGFRWFAQKKAAEHNILGYVRNLPGNVVLIVAEGETKDLETFTDYLKTGPPMSRVSEISVSKSPYTGMFTEFSVRY